MDNQITPLTPQQVFDNALFGIRKQEYAPSRVSGGGCAYQGAQGRMCGIGHSVPTEELRRLMDRVGTLADGSPIEEVLRAARWVPNLHLVTVLFGQCDEAFLLQVQAAHDELNPHTRGVWVDDPKHYFESAMRGIAASYNLTYTPPEAA